MKASSGSGEWPIRRVLRSVVVLMMLIVTKLKQGCACWGTELEILVLRGFAADICTQKLKNSGFPVARNGVFW